MPLSSTPQDIFEPSSYYELCADCRAVRLYFELREGGILQTNGQNGRRMRVMNVTDFNHANQVFELFDESTELSIFRRVQTLPNTKEGFRWMKEWLDNCVSRHDMCATKHSRLIPTRLIALNGVLRIVTPKSTSIVGSYAALSHCWGKTPSMKANTGDIKSLHRIIPWHELPQSFKDAVEVTRRLSIDYLWIDALCILQDSRADWKSEASRMGDYYQNAHLTISALDAPDGHSGFLQSARSLSTVQLRDGSCWRLRGPTWDQAMQASPLARRGWVFQERIQSKRIIHFAKNELLWECMTCRAEEGRVGYHDASKIKTSLAGHIPFHASAAELRQWYGIVGQYSSLNLTFDEDIFAAISGIAQEFQKATGLTYVGGIWLEHFPYGLLWYCDEVRIDGISLVAPSWSWASRRGPIKMIYTLPTTTPGKSHVAMATHEGDHDNINVQANLLDIQYEPDYDPLRPCRNIRMRVEAYCTMTHCLRSCDSRPPYTNPDLRRELDIYDQSHRQIGTGHLDYDMQLEDDSKECMAIILMQQDIGDRDDLPWWTREHVDDDAKIMYFMLVEKVLVNGMAVYKRIGIGQTVDAVNRRVFDTRWVQDIKKDEFIL
ncbi:hypothetical protein HBI17_121700 [Parastagonospora nodorum]|nr:hypothetical protein HBI17_121700 [Parastagonospora nodorum]KAH6427548.1 hypothetical protein HBI14_056030 [Parastagonospora nodorum]